MATNDERVRGSIGLLLGIPLTMIFLRAANLLDGREASDDAFSESAVPPVSAPHQNPEDPPQQRA